MDLTIVAQHLVAGKYFQIAAFTMFVYDHMLTLEREVAEIWNRQLSYITILYIVNRYGTLAQFVIMVAAFNDPSWKDETCRRFVLFEGSSSVAIVAIGKIIMIFRVFAIYERSYKMLAFLLSLWVFQIVISAVGLATGYSVPLPLGLVGCILTGRSILFPLIWISPLATDSFIFLLTVYRARKYIRYLFTQPSSDPAADALMKLLREGTIYFFLIFLANLMTALIYFLSEPDLKAVGASFNQLLTCTILSRLIINPRSSFANGGNTTTTINSKTWSRSRPLDETTPDEGYSPSENGRGSDDIFRLQRLGASYGENVLG